MDKNLVLIQFSSRKSGNCSAIAAFIRDYYAKDNVMTYYLDAENMSPCKQCNYECLKPGEICPNRSVFQLELMDAICCSDLTYFIVPDYCGFPCANYFAFNERSVGYFNGSKELLMKYLDVRKRFIVVSNTEGESFKQTLQQQTNDVPDILYLKTRKYDKISIAGDLLESAAAGADLKAFLEKDLL